MQSQDSSAHDESASLQSFERNEAKLLKEESKKVEGGLLDTIVSTISKEDPSQSQTMLVKQTEVEKHEDSSQKG